MNQDHRNREYNAWQEEDRTERFDDQSGADPYFYDPAASRNTGLGQNMGTGQIYCPSCGAPNMAGSRFCEYCGCSLEEAAELAAEHLEGSGRKISPVIIVLIIAALAAAGAAFWFVMNHDSDDGSSSDPAAEETAQADEDEDADDSGETEEGITVLENGDVSVLSSDWDWDSSYYDPSEGMYRVDAILYVKNDSEEPITGIDFTVYDKKWNLVENGLDPDAPLSASGYIDAGSKGVMVGQVWSHRKKVRPNDDTYEIETVYTNTAVRDYIVPYGQITRKYGPDGDYYDVSLSNPNDTDVDQDSIIVAVSLSGNKIKDSDATGKIDRSIPAFTEGFEQTKAFYDPNILSDPYEMEVYAIDMDLLTSD